MLAIEKEFRALCDKEEDSPGGAGKKTLDFYERMAADGPRLIGKDKVDHWRQLQKEIAELVPPPGPAGQALCVTEFGRTAPDTFVLKRGNAHVPGDKVEASLPADPDINPPRSPRTA